MITIQVVSSLSAIRPTDPSSVFYLLPLQIAAWASLTKDYTKLMPLK